MVKYFLPFIISPKGNLTKRFKPAYLMYFIKGGFILGFYGCGEKIRDGILNNILPTMPSINDYYWLGIGMYFWGNNIQ